MQEFIGRSKKSAQDLAEQYNLIFYLVKENGNDYLPYPEDVRTDRICV